MSTDRLIRSMTNDFEKQFYEIGAATLSITPEAGVSLYSLDGIVRTSSKIHSGLNVSAITIGCSKDLLIIVSLDLIWVDKIFTEKVKKWLKQYIEDYDYRAHLVLAATHSHSTPQISKKICNSTKPDEHYLFFLYSQVCQVIKNALSNKEKCYAELSVTNPKLTVNRRKKILSLDMLKRGIFKFIIANRPNYKSKIDDKLYTIWFYDLKSKEKAVLLNYACHPTLFRKNAVSADFPGAVSRNIKHQISEDVVVCFLQGFAGNVKADLTKYSCFHYSGFLPYIYSCLFDRLQFNKRISTKKLEDFSVNLAKSAMLRCESKKIYPKLLFYSKSIKLPLQGDISTKSENIDIFYISIANELKMVALGGEIFSEYSLWLRSFLMRYKVYSLTVGYCNSMVGYIPTHKAMLEGGYEVERTFEDFSHSSPFSDRIEGFIKHEIKKLIKMDLG